MVAEPFLKSWTAGSPSRSNEWCQITLVHVSKPPHSGSLPHCCTASWKSKMQYPGAKFFGLPSHMYVCSWTIFLPCNLYSDSWQMASCDSEIVVFRTIIKSFFEWVRFFRIIDGEWKYLKFVISCRIHLLGLIPLEHSGDSGAFLSAEVKVENMPFQVLRNTL